jgi:hypothetical protein
VTAETLRAGDRSGPYELVLGADMAAAFAQATQDHLRDIVIDSSQVLPLALRVFSGLGIRVDDDRTGPESELNRRTQRQQSSAAWAYTSVDHHSKAQDADGGSHVIIHHLAEEPC